MNNREHFAMSLASQILPYHIDIAFTCDAIGGVGISQIEKSTRAARSMHCCLDYEGPW